ncbi:hypothetical protein N431DRAFT_394683 [Stipitochalara longipes BDJ]|nr:hypothetical protein N431DRAFT_394683 [Stipitochalara longipes BDJ]
MDLDIPEADSQQPINWPDPNSIRMPDYFWDKLRNICPYCECKGGILWRNLHRAEPHFDACFRYFEGSPAHPVPPVSLAEDKGHRRCFLKLYTLRVPFLACQPVALSLVHHVRAEGKNFVPAKPGSVNQEHIFGFIAGFSSLELGRILTDLFARWKDIAEDHLMKATAGMTPRLFMATVLSQYGWAVAQEVIKSGRTLVHCDKNLQAALTKLKDAEPGSSDDVTAEIGRMNETLINMNIRLTGTRSTMHYLAESAHTLINGVSTFEQYIHARLSEWKDNDDAEPLKDALRELDSCKESIRDNDKLELVRKTMGQYKIDIKSLQQHIDISVGMVRNLIAERDKVIQNIIAGNTARDGFVMKVIAVLTAFFLPGTFMAIFLASPMFDFKNTKSVVVDLPTRLYWSIAGSVTVLLLIGQLFFSLPEWTINTIDTLLPCLKNSRLYTEAERRKTDKDSLTKAKDSVNPERRGTGGSGFSGKTQNSEAQASHKEAAIQAESPIQEKEVRQREHWWVGLLPSLQRRSLPNPDGDGKV